MRVDAYEPRGAALELFKRRDPEILIEGPAGTGKTRAVLEYVNFMCELYPGMRVLLLRKTRVSMTESVLVTWEDKVLGPGHYMTQGAKRNHRSSYDRHNGSHIALCGMDEPSRLFSSEYDIIVPIEAIEFTLLEYMSLFRANRNNVTPVQQIICETNPGSAAHWLNVRANAGRMTRLLSRHEDNPTLSVEYLTKLSNLTGAMRARMFLGLWVSEEGQVWEVYDPKTHLIPFKDVPPLRWHFASVDWGFRAPGVLQVWGVSADGRLYRVHEIYQTKKQLDWWADRVCKLDQEYKFEAIVCDPAEPRSIEFFNDRIGAMRGRHMSRLAREGMNRVVPGLDMVRWALTPDDDGRPLMYLVDGALEAADPDLIEQGKPLCAEQEIPSYVFKKGEDGKPVRELPDPGCADHACDATRYAASFFWGREGAEAWRGRAAAQPVDPRSVGAILTTAFGKTPEEFLSEPQDS